MKVFAFGHQSRMGKDTCAKFLTGHIRATKRNVSVITTGFSSKLKAVCYDLYKHLGLMDEAFYEDDINQHLRFAKLPKIDKTPVEIWIEFGTNVGRVVYSNTWVEYPFQKPCDYLIIKDLRFPNEFEAIKKHGGYCIKIFNPRIELTNSVADIALNDCRNWDFIMPNDMDLKVLNQRVIDLFSHLI